MGKCSSATTKKPNPKAAKPRLKAASKKPSSKPLNLNRPPKSRGVIRKDAALRALRLPADALARAPQITDILKSAFGKVKDAIAALRFSDDTAAIEFLSVYDDLPVFDRDLIPVEAICVKADVSPTAVLGACLVASKSIKGMESALLSVNNHPAVLRETIRFAMLPGGQADRKVLHEAVGFLPTPKGVAMNVNLLGGNPQLSNPQRKGDDGDEDENFDEMFPSINQRLDKWSDDRKKLLAEKN